MDNIGVAIRVRPMVQRELLKDSEEHWKVNGNTIYQLEHGVPVPSSIINPTAFIFDKVYSGNDTTESLYDEFAKPLVLKAMEGFNGTIFAYGQTGTGKTFTMMGLPENPGVIPRAINDVFDLVHMAPDREFLIRVSYMEIYNEVITDLLKVESSHLKVRNNEKNEVFVENLSEVPIRSPEDALSYLQNGERLRRFAETNMNERSSRSHTIFRVTIESKLRSVNPDDTAQDSGAVIVSQLNLVDLAGSERAAQTGAQGTRLKESGFINKSLLSLGTVISKLSSAGEERSFVPYRDSKLTRILQNSLGGNAKTSVIATVSAAAGDETFSTLKFASRAKTIKNKPKVNEVLDGDTMIKKYRKEINMLKKQIDEIQDLTNLKTLKTENEKMEQLLEENEKMRREQQSKINSLQKMIISATEETFNKRKKLLKGARRETWCPGKLKRSLARASIDRPSLLLSISSEDETEEEGISFSENTAGFIMELEKEERKSLEQLKRRSSKDGSLRQKAQYRRSYQVGTNLTLKVNQACQTEPTREEEGDTKEPSGHNVDEDTLMEKLQKLTAEKEEQCEIISLLQLRLEEYNASHPSEVTEDAKEELQKSPRSIIGTRRKLEHPSGEAQPSKKMQLLDHNEAAVLGLLTPKATKEGETSPSKTELKEELSLANFIILEKDCQTEELETQLRQAQGRLREKECAIKELEDEISSLEYNDDAKSHAEEKITSLTADVDSLTTECQELRKSKEEVEKSLDEKNEEFKKLESMFQEERDGFVHTESKLQRLKVQNEDLMWRLKELEESKMSNGKGESDAQPEAAKLIEELAAIKLHVEDLEGTRAELLLKIEELEVEKASQYASGADSFVKHEESMLNDTAKLNDLEAAFMERAAAVEELHFKIEELQLENESLKSKNKQQESHLEMLAKDNLSFQAEISCLNERSKLEEVNNGDNSIDKEYQMSEEMLLKVRELEQTIEELQAEATNGSENDEEKINFIQELAAKDKIIKELTMTRTTEMHENEVEEMKTRIEELVKINEELAKAADEKSLEKQNASDCEATESSNTANDYGQVLENGSSGLTETFSNENSLDGITEKEIEALKLKVLELDEINQKLQSDAQNVVSSETFDKLALEFDQLEEVNKNLRNELSVKKEELLAEQGDGEKAEELELEIERLLDVNNQLEVKIKESNQVVITEEKETALQNEIKKLKLDLEELGRVNEELRSSVHETVAVSTKEEEKHDFAFLHKEIDELKAEIERLGNANEELMGKLECESKKAADKESEDAAGREEMDTLQMKIVELEKTNEELRMEILEKQEALEAVKETANEEEIGLLKCRVAELEQINKQLEEGIQIKIEIPEVSEIESKNDSEIEKLKSKVTGLEKENAELQSCVSISKDENKVSVILKNELEESKCKFTKLEKLNEDLQQRLLDYEVAVKEKEVVVEELSLLKVELEQLKSQTRGDVHNESTEEHFEQMTMKIMELEENKEELVARTQSLEKENNDLQEKLSNSEVSISSSNEIQQENCELKSTALEMKQSNSELEGKVVTLETKCSAMSQQLCLLSNDLQSAEDENVALLEKINSLTQSHGADDGKSECLVNELQALVEDLRVQLREKEEQLATLKDKMSSVSTENNAELEEKALKMEEKCSKMSSQLSMLSNDLQTAEEENMALLAKLNQLQKDHEREMELKDQLTKELQNGSEAVESNGVNLNQSEELAACLNEEISALKDINEILESKLFTANKECSDLAEKARTAEDTRLKSEEECSKRCQEIQKLENDIEHLNEESIKNDEKRADLEEMLKEASDRIGQLEAELKTLADRERKATMEISQLKERNLETVESQAEHEERQAELCREIEQLKEDLQQLNTASAEKDDEISRLEKLKKDEEESMNKEMLKMTDSIKAVSEKEKVALEEITNLKALLAEKEESIATGERKQSELLEKIITANAEFHELKQDDARKLEKIKKLEESIDSKEDVSVKETERLRDALKTLTEKEQDSYDKLSQLQTEYKEKELAIEETAARCLELCQEIEGTKKALEKAHVEIDTKNEEIRKLKETANNTCAKTEIQPTKLSEELESTIRREKAVVEELAVLKDLYSESKEANVQTETIQFELNEEILELKASLQDVSEQNEKKDDEIKKLEKMVDDSDKELYKMNLALKASGEKEASTTNELLKLKELLSERKGLGSGEENNNSELEKEITDLKDDMTKLRQEMVKKEAEIMELEKMVDDSDEEIHQLRKAVKCSMDKEDALKGELSRLKNNPAESEVVSSLREELSAIKKEKLEKMSENKEVNVRTEDVKCESNENTFKLKVNLQNLSEENKKKEEEIKKLEKMVDDSDEELYKMNLALKASGEKEEVTTKELLKLKELLSQRGDLSGGDENNNPELKKEIINLKDDMMKLKQEMAKKDGEIKELEKMVDDSDEEIYQLRKAVKCSMDKEEALKEELSKLKNISADSEAVSSLREELSAIKKKKFENFIHVGSMEKENERLKEKLVESEKAMTSYQEYQEQRVAGLKQELKRLIEANGKPAAKEIKQARSVIESTALFTLKSEKATLERDNTKMKAELDDLNKKNNALALEKFNLEFKFNDLKSECYHLKRGLRPASADVKTQTTKESSPPLTVNASGQENVGQKAFFDPEDLPFRREEKDEPQQCTQQ